MDYNKIICTSIFCTIFTGLQDYEAALKIEPDNESLKSDADRIRRVILSSSGTEDP